MRLQSAEQARAHRWCSCTRRLDPLANHQVLALGYTWEPHAPATIQIYDRTTLIGPLCRSRWPGDRLHDLHQSTGEAVRGFFVEYYRPRAMRLPA